MRAVLASATAALALATTLCVCVSLGNASSVSAAAHHTAPSAQLPITDDLDGFQLPTK